MPNENWTNRPQKKIWLIGCHAPRKNGSAQWNFYAVNTMEIQQDFKDLLALLNKHEVEYLIVGGYALAFHGAPRFTGDIDIYIRPEPENAKRVLKSLNEFGFQFPNLNLEDFYSPDQIIQLGVPPVRIDILTSISGVTWDQAAASRIPSEYGNIPVNYIGKIELIQNKRATGRRKDLADLEALGEEE